MSSRGVMDRWGRRQGSSAWFSAGFAIPFMKFCLRGWNPKRRVNASSGADVGMVGAGLGDVGG